MIKCYFVDVKNISSTVPISKFAESELDRLADTILAVDGLLRPLIIKEVEPEKYIVIEGHREYYAALKAKEKDLNKAEMVNAFVIKDQLENSAIEQLKLLQDSQPEPIEDRSVKSDRSELVDLLLPNLLSAISQQLQPIVAQLDEHKEILDVLISARQIPSIQKPSDLRSPELPPTDPIGLPVNSPTILAATTPTTKPPKTPKIPKAPKEPKVPKTPKATKPPKFSISQSPPAPTTSVDNSFRSPRAIEVIDLIDKLSREQLTIRMERSGISKPSLKLIDNIINERDSQAAGKFHTWETIVNAKIKGLGAARIQEIIDKLK
jgi:ParB-like nuclease domain